MKTGGNQEYIKPTRAPYLSSPLAFVPTTGAGTPLILLIASLSPVLRLNGLSPVLSLLKIAEIGAAEGRLFSFQFSMWSRHLVSSCIGVRRPARST
jgi:hypothetical protein